MHDEGLLAPVIEDRGDDAVAARQALADLDLLVATIEAAAQLEDPTQTRRQPARSRESSRRSPYAPRPEARPAQAADEEGRHRGAAWAAASDIAFAPPASSSGS